MKFSTIKFGILPLLGMAFATMASAEEQHRQYAAHVHGHASITLAVSGNAVQLDLESPAMNLLGFEHAPGNEQDRKKLNDAAEFLQRPLDWVRFDGGSGCKVVHVDVESSLLHRESHGHDHHGHEGHADFEVTVEFECANPARISHIDLSGLFSRFPGFQEIEAQWLTDQIQSGDELDAHNAVIKLR